MAPPTIVSVTPLNGETDVVLGADVLVTFDQVIDTTTFNDSTFSLSGPGQTAILTPENLIAANPTATTGRQFITGTFSFATDTTVTPNRTVATFKPSQPLQPNQTYTVILVGSNNALLANVIQNPGAEKLVNTYQWTFTTGILNLTLPPVPSPLPDASPAIDPASITINPRGLLRNDLSQVIQINFPGPIDPTTIDLTQILLSLEPFVGDPSVVVPGGLTTTAQLVNNNQTIQITITGWPPGF